MQRFRQKAQSAIEYLMTYSWAILLTAIILSAMFTLGVFDSKKATSNVCIFSAPFICTNTSMSTSGNLTISFGQATFSPLEVTAIRCNSNGDTVTMNAVSPNRYIGIGGVASLKVLCYDGSGVFSRDVGTQYSGYVVINYTEVQTGISKTITAKLSQKVTTVAVATTSSVSTTSTTSTIESTTSTTSTTTTSIPYAAITLTNLQSTGTSTNFQQQLIVPTSSYSSYINSNWTNVEFTASAPISTSGNVPLYAWIESGASNSASSTTIWVNLSSNTIGAAGSDSNTLTIYMSFLTDNVMTSSTSYTGIAPNRYCGSGCAATVYAQYDNGNRVFGFYDNFAGPSLSGKWTSSGGTITVNNGLTITSSSPAYILSTSGFNSITQTMDLYTYGSGSYDDWYFVLDSGFNNLYGIRQASGTYKINQFNGAEGNKNLAGSQSTSSYNLFTVYTSTSTTYVMTSYNSLTSLSTDFTFKPSMKIGFRTAAGSGASSIYSNYVRIRASPPNDIMPTTSFGSVV